MPNPAAIPAWLNQMDADEAAQAAPPPQGLDLVEQQDALDAAQAAPRRPLPPQGQTPQAVTTQPVPDWLTKMDADEAAQQRPQPQAAPASPAPSHPVSAPSGDTYGDAYNFLRAAATNAAAGIAGLPNLFDQAGDYLARKTGVGTPSTASPFAGAAPTADKAADYLFNHTAPEYQPKTTVGQYGMAAASAAIPAVLGAPETVIPNAIRGAAAGAAAMGANDMGLPAWTGPAATVLGELAARHGVGAVLKPHTSSGVAATGGKILNEIAPPPATTAAPAVPGLQLTTGQLTNDPGYLSLDNEMNGTALAQQQSAAMLSGNQAIIRDNLGKVAAGPGGADAALAQAQNVTAANKASIGAVKQDWAAVPLDTRVNITSLKSALQQHLDAAAESGDNLWMPKAQIDDLMALGDTPTLSAMQARRSSLTSTVDTLNNSAIENAGNKQRVAKGVLDLVGNHLDDESNVIGSPDAITAYKNARASSAQRAATFGDDNTAGAQIPDVVSKGIAPESTLSRMLPPGAEGTGAQSLSRLKMASGTGTGLDPARAYLVGKLKDAVDSGPNAFGKVLDDYGYAFKDKAMFTQEQQATMQDASDAVAQTYRKAAPGADIGSPTLDKLKGGSFARVLYGNILGTVLPKLAKPVGSLAGGMLAAHTGLAAGATEITGNLMAGEAAGQAHTGAMAGARQNIMGVLDQARKDPAFARQLQMRASQGNLALAPRLRNTLKMLGLSEAQALPGAPRSGVAD